MSGKVVRLQGVVTVRASDPESKRLQALANALDALGMKEVTVHLTILVSEGSGYLAIEQAASLDDGGFDPVRYVQTGPPRRVTLLIHSPLRFLRWRAELPTTGDEVTFLIDVVGRC